MGCSWSRSKKSATVVPYSATDAHAQSRQDIECIGIQTSLPLLNDFEENPVLDTRNTLGQQAPTEFQKKYMRNDKDLTEASRRISNFSHPPEHSPLRVSSGPLLQLEDVDDIITRSGLVAASPPLATHGAGQASIATMTSSANQNVDKINSMDSALLSPNAAAPKRKRSSSRGALGFSNTRKGEQEVSSSSLGSFVNTSGDQRQEFSSVSLVSNGKNDGSTSITFRSCGSFNADTMHKKSPHSSARLENSCSLIPLEPTVVEDKEDVLNSSKNDGNTEASSAQAETITEIKEIAAVEESRNETNGTTCVTLPGTNEISTAINSELPLSASSLVRASVSIIIAEAAVDPAASAFSNKQLSDDKNNNLNDVVYLAAHKNLPGSMSSESLISCATSSDRSAVDKAFGDLGDKLFSDTEHEHQQSISASLQLHETALARISSEEHQKQQSAAFFEPKPVLIVEQTEIGPEEQQITSSETKNSEIKDTTSFSSEAVIAAELIISTVQEVSKQSEHELKPDDIPTSSELTHMLPDTLIISHTNENGQNTLHERVPLPVSMQSLSDIPSAAQSEPSSPVKELTACPAAESPLEQSVAATEHGLIHTKVLLPESLNSVLGSNSLNTSVKETISGVVADEPPLGLSLSLPKHETGAASNVVPSEVALPVSVSSINELTKEGSSAQGQNSLLQQQLAAAQQKHTTTGNSKLNPLPLKPSHSLEEVEAKATTSTKSISSSTGNLHTKGVIARPRRPGSGRMQP